MNELQKIESFKRELAVAETFEEIKLLGSAADAMAEFAKKNNMAKEQQNEIGIYRIDVEAKKGAWLNENFPHGVRNDRRGSEVVPLPMPASKKESSSARMIERMPEKVKETIIEELKESKKIITPQAVVNEFKKVERKEKIEAQIIEINKGIDRPKGVYNVIAIDPPWSYTRGYDPDGSRGALPYPTMSQQQLKDFEIPSSDNCIMWLWTTQAFIWDAKELLNHWGFTYKAILTWDKEKMGMGSWLRMQTEFCLMGVKGNPILKNHGTRDIIREPRGKHSAKPEVFYKLVEELCPGNKIEIFSRTNRENWDVYGDEI